MPAEGVELMSHEDILTYEEIHTVARAAAELGINKVRLTGGEPLVRSGLSELIRMLAQIDGIDDISLTTNGTLLSHYAAELKQAGLHRVNVSLDTLKQDKFSLITRSNLALDDVLAGIEAARSVGLDPVKLNMVVVSGVNDDEILDFTAKTIDEGWHVRFIEFMSLGGVGSSNSRFTSVSEMRKRLEQVGELQPCLPDVGNGPARYFRFPNARGTVGFITPVSEHFCFHCNRLRLTADGRLRLCLLAEDEIDLRQSLRSGASLAELKQLIKAAAADKPLRHRLAEGLTSEDRPMTQVGG
jgi:cyclic pyranopterin phosphate synthase